MPYSPVQIPFRGISIDSGYSSLPSGFTAECMNVVPYDAYKGKLRIGQRRALLGAYTFNTSPTSATRNVQVIMRADAYVAGSLKQQCVVVAGGEVYLIRDGSTTPLYCTRGAGISKMKDSGHIGAAVLGQYCYFADGTYYRKVDITSATPAVVDWTGAQDPYTHVKSTATGSTTYATLLVRFGGRLAMAGVAGAPNVWFLSKLNDADTWDPSAASNTASPCAGSNSTRFATPGEPIVALIPVGESGLMFAGKHTLNYMTADPVVSTARIVEMSRSVGIVSERAWCASDAQTIYMMAQDGLYRIQPNDYQVTQSNRVTTARLDTFFQNQRFNVLNCVLGYDAEAQNVYCFMSRTDFPGSSVHLVYSQGTDSFWPIQSGWSSFHAPTCCGDFPFGDARAPILALGSEDGYMGWFDRNLTSGVDGQAAVGYKGGPFSVSNTQASSQRIESILTLGPVLQPSLGQVMMKDVRVELTMDDPVENSNFSTPVQRLSGPFLSVLSGQTAEEAIGENIVSVTVAVDPDFPSIIIDGGLQPDGGGNPSFNATTLDCDVYNNNSPANSIDLFYPDEIAGTYTTSDTLITDPTARSYFKGSIYLSNSQPAASADWFIQHNLGTAYNRDTSLGNTSADTPGGTYVYWSPYSVTGLGAPLPTIIGTPPRYSVSSATYDNTNENVLGQMLSGRNDAFRCRIRDQAAYVRITSHGVPWAVERMSVLIEPYGHTKNVKGTY